MARQRIAIIGAGGHARAQHYPALRHIDAIELCAACDLLPEKLAEVQIAYNVPAIYSDFREMIEKETPDGVVVVMSPMQMFDVVMGCLDMGVDLMIEKPPGCNSEQSQQFLDAAAKSGSKIMVSVNRRFMPLVRELKRTAQERGLVYVSSTYNKDGFTADKWTWPSPLPVADAIHNIDLMRFVGGDVAEVFGVSACRDARFSNTHSATIAYESGAMGSINTHHCVGARVHRFEIHAMGMSAYLDVGDTRSPKCELFLEAEPAEPPSHNAPDLPADLGIENYYETLHFARWIAGEEQAEADLADVIQSVRLAEAVAEGYRGPLPAPATRCTP